MSVFHHFSIDKSCISSLNIFHFPTYSPPTQTSFAPYNFQHVTRDYRKLHFPPSKNAIRHFDVVRLTSERGRAQQMNYGAAYAQGQILLFLHADTELPGGALCAVEQALSDPAYVGGAFSLKIDSNRLFLRYIGARANLRSRITRIPYGDQSFFLRKAYFQRIGGFSEIPLMEDVDLMRRIKQDGQRIRILKDKVLTSARRWETEGMFYTTFRNQVVVVLYYLGMSPKRLIRFYRSQRELK